MYMNTILCWGFLIVFMVLYGINAVNKKEGYSNIMAMDYFMPHIKRVEHKVTAKNFVYNLPVILEVVYVVMVVAENI